MRMTPLPAPATEAPVEKPTMAVEEIDPEELHFTAAAGSIAYNEDTAPLCVKAGANVLVAGSAVFGKADRAAAVAGIRGSL